MKIYQDIFLVIGGFQGETVSMFEMDGIVTTYVLHLFVKEFVHM
jgi:hypothetical protein